MDHVAVGSIYLSMFVAGLAASLHCIGMCGPLLVGFSQIFEQSQSTKQSRLVSMAAYHLGRLWTYALLGFIAGQMGMGMRHGSALLGWQKPASLVLGSLVIAVGFLLLGVVPGFQIEQKMACSIKKFGDANWFKSLVGSRGFAAKLLLGVVMGFLPCGLVYAMLLVAITLPSPAYSALAMVVFGIGTLPALSMVFGISTWLKNKANTKWQTRLRQMGTKLAAIMIILTGAWMLTRALMPHQHHRHGSQHLMPTTQPTTQSATQPTTQPPR